MNASFKTIAAAVALALSGAASASTLDGEELFFTAWNNNPDAASSIVINLNETTTAFRGDADSTRELSGASLTTLTNWLTSLSPADRSTVQWNVMGAMQGPLASPTYGFLTTSTDVTTRDPGGWGQFTGLDGTVDGINNYFPTVNPQLASTDAFFAPNSFQVYIPPAGITTVGALGQAVEFYGLIADQSGNEFFEGDYFSLNGSWTLDYQGGVASLEYAPVPLPAAVWLFGSGLLGLFGIGRRKSV